MTETGWTRNTPTENGIYWYRLDAQSLPDIVQVHDDDVYYTGEATACGLANHDDEWLGPLSPSDFEQLIRLREAAGDAAQWIDELLLARPLSRRCS